MTSPLPLVINTADFKAGCGEGRISEGSVAKVVYGGQCGGGLLQKHCHLAMWQHLFNNLYVLVLYYHMTACFMM